jgi:hypothetical protein
VHWRPISLKVKNNVQPDSPWFERAARTHNLLRVFESVRATEGEEKLGALYRAFGRRIHNEATPEFDPVDALVEAGLPTSHAAAFDDDSFDEIIRAHMDDGLALVGTDVGTPIIAFTNEAGKRVGFFGPVISQVPSHADGLKLWDGLVLAAGFDHFWELKRTRTEQPQFPDSV